MKTIIDTFEIIAPNVEEPKFSTPQETAEKLALLKAIKVFETNRDAVVIAADTVVDLDGEILTKPSDEFEARQQLIKLMKRWHRVHTAIAIVSEFEIWLKLKSAHVKFREVPMEFLSFYASNHSLDKAGSYGLQDIGAVFVECVVGDPYVVIGLPVYEVWYYLHSRGLWCAEATREDEGCRA